MTHPHFVLLYVKDVAASAFFYQSTLAKAPLEQSPGFAMFALANDLMLGLWRRDHVQPATTGTGNDGELAFALPSEMAVRERHDAWQQQGVTILQSPVEMDFGFTFLAADPDGHRLRVFAPAG